MPAPSYHQPSVSKPLIRTARTFGRPSKYARSVMSKTVSVYALKDRAMREPLKKNSALTAVPSKQTSS